ncbi:hypothetical protein [Bacillus sp. FDAARGOS_1420]|uniref:hypothetical protein n=1 Tax=unclassified Bacillus (in: firmicutes) TaxID=185979 RepID=UPI001C5AB564|nr:hypothetical protein [Bacillus sp. FDAARGOS_1420]MBW3496799.1 hypothetical protein [Bacillus sp. FDAARGOS_1420]
MRATGPTGSTGATGAPGIPLGPTGPRLYVSNIPGLGGNMVSVFDKASLNVIGTITLRGRLA